MDKHILLQQHRNTQLKPAETCNPVQAATLMEMRAYSVTRVAG
jgi:hypothetical protein